MRILILDEGRAGHRSQSRAIAMALRRSFAVTEVTLFCKVRVGFFQKILRFLLNRRGVSIPSFFFRMTHKGDPLPEEAPDLIVSAGGGTLYANAWLARYYQRPNLFCGELRGLDARHFKAVVSGYERYRGIEPYLISPTPVPIEKSVLAEAGRAFRERAGIGESRCWSLLAGGDGAGYHYRNEDWKALAEGMKTLAEKHGIRWLVTTSRRSGRVAEEEIAAAIDGASVAGAYYAGRGTGDITYQEILGTAERHFCTEDSHMMISEAIASGCPVHALSPVRYETHHTNEYFLKLYTEKGWLSRHAIARMGEIDFSPTSPSSEHPRVMEELAERLREWWLERGEKC